MDIRSSTSLDIIEHQKWRSICTNNSQWNTINEIEILALLPRKMVIDSTVLKDGDRLYHNKICDALGKLEHDQFKSFQSGHSRYDFYWKHTQVLHCWSATKLCWNRYFFTNTSFFQYFLSSPRHYNWLYTMWNTIKK